MSSASRLGRMDSGESVWKPLYKASDAWEQGKLGGISETTRQTTSSY
jgi:hypothetical protein